MSREARIPEHVLELMRDASGSECRIAWALYMHANKDGECWPSYSRIQAVAGCDHRTVERMLNRLEGRGVVLERKGPSGKRRSNTYILLMEGGEMTPYERGRNDPVGGDEMTPQIQGEMTPRTKDLELSNEPPTVLEPRECANPDCVGGRVSLPNVGQSIPCPICQKKGGGKDEL